MGYRTRISGIVTRVEMKQLGRQDVCIVTVPVNFREKQGENWGDGVHWYEIAGWGEKAAEYYKNYIKDDVLEVEGRLDVRAFVKQDGTPGLNFRLVNPFIEFSPRGRNKAAHDLHEAALATAGGIAEVEQIEAMAAGVDVLF
jgi:single-stranded DNA-binding protein